MEKRRMSIFGVGPVLVLTGLGIIAAGFVINGFMPGFFRFITLGVWAKLFASIWSLIGLYFWLASAKMVVRDVPQSRLMTTGVFHFCRNPMYAGFIVFILPGLAFLFNMWFFLVAAFVTGFVFSKLIKKEEDALEEMFGDEYRSYRGRVPMLFPWRCMV